MPIESIPVPPQSIEVVSKGGSSFLGNFFGFFFKKWRLWFMVLIVIFALISGTMKSIDAGSSYPLFEEVGGRLVVADNHIYSLIAENGYVLQKYTAPDSDSAWVLLKSKLSYGWKIFSFFWLIIEDLFVIYWWGWLFYKIYSKVLIDSPFIMATFTFLTLAMFMVVFNLLFFILTCKYSGQAIELDKLVWAFIPFKGVAYALPKLIYGFFNPMMVATPIENIIQNKTLINNTLPYI